MRRLNNLQYLQGLSCQRVGVLSLDLLRPRPPRFLSLRELLLLPRRGRGWPEPLLSSLTPIASSSYSPKSKPLTKSDRSDMESVAALADSGAGASAGSRRESAAVICLMMSAREASVCLWS